jgi:hypothetical protein
MSNRNFLSGNRTFWIDDDDDEESVTNERRTVAGETSASNRSTLSRNGVPLHPIPTADPLNLLNWTAFRKHTILAIVMGL